MAEVKRYSSDNGEVYRNANGGLVLHSEHDRIVSRLQRARARNLVRALQWQCCYLMAGWGESDVTHRKLRLADRIAAKYLGER